MHTSVDSSDLIPGTDPLLAGWLAGWLAALQTQTTPQFRNQDPLDPLPTTPDIYNVKGCDELGLSPEEAAHFREFGVSRS
jgi:hypothetical protein